MLHLRLWMIIALALAGCGSGNSGGSESPIDPVSPDPGPAVVWDFEALPLPDVPLPNDISTRLDPTSPTGRRINVPLEATTRYERRTRELFSRLDGFGAYAAITVRFDGPLDLADILRRHRDNDDFRDDAFFLFNVDRTCSRFGEEIAVDIGRRRFPVTLGSRSRRRADAQAPFGFRLDEAGNKMFPFDPRGESLNLLFPDQSEDRNRNGTLDPGEDLNEDGVLDVANFLDPHACDGIPAATVEHDRCIADNLIPWYERSTDTLILRPVWPMQERCVHAVVLTRRLRGKNGQPVRSPFRAVQFADQNRAVRPVYDLLPRYDLSNGDVAFMWSFTVGTMTKDVEQLRAGLYGHGPLARLAEEFPVSGLNVLTRNEWRQRGGDSLLTSGGEVRLSSGGCVSAALTTLAGQFDGDRQICGGYADFASIGGMFAGTFQAPNLLADKDGEATAMYPADEDEVWDLEPDASQASYGATDVTFFCVLPREDARPDNVVCESGNPQGQPWCKPYPVVFYAHGYGGSKGELVLHAGRHTQMGMAACGIDSFGHGLQSGLQEDCPGNTEYQLAKLLAARSGYPEVVTMIFYGRDRDLNNDGCRDSGADQWTASLFHTRDVVRQSVLEQMQFVRILHAIDGKALDAQGNVLGDVDGDGEPDFGGANSITAAWGISLGGQLTAVLAGAEPALDMVSPNAAGAGLTDIAIRLGEGGLPEAVMLPVQGPILVACLPVDGHQNPLAEGQNGAGCLPRTSQQPAAGPQRAGELLLAWYAHDNARLSVHAIARVPGVAAGDRLVVENLENQATSSARINRRGWARVNIAADALSPIKKRALLGLRDGDRAAVPAADTTQLGDRIRVRIIDGNTGAEKSVITSWEWDVTFQGAIYGAGQPLVALQEGLGRVRNTPEFRRYYGIAQNAIMQADPAVWSRRYTDEPIEAPYDPAWWPGRLHVLVMPTVGDTQVPTATGVALGRTAGLLGSWNRNADHFSPEHGWRELLTPDPRYGVSIDQWLIDHHVVEGDWHLQRWASTGPNPHVLFDPDDVSDASASFSCLHSTDWSAANGEFRCPTEIDDTDTRFSVPRPEPGKALRRNRPRPDGTFDAFRVPLLRPAGQHGIYNPQPFRVFDADTFMVNFTVRSMATRGRDLEHKSGCDCSYVTRPLFEIGGRRAWPGLEDVRSCPDDDSGYGKSCSPQCAAAWGFTAIPLTVCGP